MGQVTAQGLRSQGMGQMVGHASESPGMGQVVEQGLKSQDMVRIIGQMLGLCNDNITSCSALNKKHRIQQYTVCDIPMILSKLTCG